MSNILVSWQFPTFAAFFAGSLLLVNVFSAAGELDFEESVPREKGILGRLKNFFVRPLAAFNSYLPLPGYRKYVEKLLSDSGDMFTKFEVFLARQEVMAVLTPLFVGFCIDEWAPEVLLPCAMLGAAVPVIRQDAARKKRLRTLKRELPFFMDLLTLSVEAGADFAFAISRIVEALDDGPMRQEMLLLLSRLKSGSSRRQAITGLSERANFPDMVSLCAAMIQAGETGTSLVTVLRAQSSFIRARQTEEWREKAKKASTKIIIPLVLFVFPTMFLIIMGPVALSLWETYLANF